MAGLASYDLLIQDAKLVESNFTELSYSHIKREGNKVAHGLARLALVKFRYMDGRCSTINFSFCSN